MATRYRSRKKVGSIQVCLLTASDATVSTENRIRIHGLNGEVKEVYRAKATLRFGHLRQPNLDIVTLDLSTVSRQTGTEVSGFLGFAMLQQVEVELDYRDGIVNFKYDPKRTSPFAR